MSRYVNVFTAPGLLGAPTRAHASRLYTTAAEAIGSRDVLPDAGFALAGTLDLAARGGPRFVSLVVLRRAAEDAALPERTAEPV